MWKNLVYRVGHRGAFLLFLSLLDFIYGWSLFLTATTANGPYSKLVLWFPWAVWGWAWIAVGALLLVGTFVRDDRVYFGVSATFKGVWAAAWLSGWLFHGVYLGWVSAVIWGAFAALVVVVSSWRENRRVVDPAEAEEESRSVLRKIRKDIKDSMP